MNRRHLSFVLGVAEHGSFGAAAAACNVTQPTLSAGVRQIEDHLGARLFERNTRHVALTRFGQEVLPSIRDVVNAEVALETHAKALLEPPSKMYRIGVSPIVEMSKVVDLFRPYRDQNPDVSFVFKECFLDNLETRLLSEEIDLAIWPEAIIKNESFDTTGFYADPWVFLPNAAIQTKPEGIPQSISEIAEQPLILTSGYCGLSQATQFLYEQMDQELNLYPGRAISYTAIEEWADLGLGAALLPASKISRGRQGLVVPVLNEDRSAAMLSIGVSWAAGRSASRHLKGLVSFLRGLVPASE